MFSILLWRWERVRTKVIHVSVFILYILNWACRHLLEVLKSVLHSWIIILESFLKTFNYKFTHLTFFLKFDLSPLDPQTFCSCGSFWDMVARGNKSWTGLWKSNWRSCLCIYGSAISAVTPGLLSFHSSCFWLQRPKRWKSATFTCRVGNWQNCRCCMLNSSSGFKFHWSHWNKFRNLVQCRAIACPVHATFSKYPSHCLQGMGQAMLCVKIMEPNPSSKRNDKPNTQEETLAESLIYLLW